MESTCQQHQAQQQNGTAASRTSFLIEDILNRGNAHPAVHAQHHLHHQLTPAHSQHHQYEQFASLLPSYPSGPPAAAFFLGPLFGTAGMGVVPGVSELAALKHCRRRKARTVSQFSYHLSRIANGATSRKAFSSWDNLHFGSKTRQFSKIIHKRSSHTIFQIREFFWNIIFWYWNEMISKHSRIFSSTKFFSYMLR